MKGMRLFSRAERQALRVAAETVEAHQMIEQLKSSQILSGYRGAPPSDIDAIADCLERLSQLALDFPELHELDMNPLIVFEQGKGAAVVDARIFIS